MSLNDDSIAVKAADATLAYVLTFLKDLEKRYPNENIEENAMEPIRNVMDQLCGWGAKEYNLYGRK